MTSAVVRMVRDTIARVRHVSPAGARQEAAALVEKLPHADREVLRLWVRALARELVLRHPSSGEASTARPDALSDADWQRCRDAINADVRDDGARILLHRALNHWRGEVKS